MPPKALLHHPARRCREPQRRNGYGLLLRHLGWASIAFVMAASITCREPGVILHPLSPAHRAAVLIVIGQLICVGALARHGCFWRYPLRRPWALGSSVGPVVPVSPTAAKLAVVLALVSRERPCNRRPDSSP